MQKRTRLLIIVAVLTVCFGFLLPSINWYVRTPKEVQTLALGSLEKIKDYSIVMAATDVNALKALAKETPEREIPDGFRWLRKSAKENFKLTRKTFPKQLTLREALLSYDAENDLQTEIEGRYRANILKAKKLYANSVKLGLDLSGGMSVTVKADLDAALASQEGSSTTENAAQFREDAISQAVETLRGRIDRFGLTEPVIRQQGEDRIYIELPGAAEADQINSIIVGKGILNFRLVDSAATESFTGAYRQNPAGIFTITGELLNQSLIPEDCEVIGLYRKDDYDLDERTGYLVVKKDIALDGKHIKSAQVGSDITGRPEVNFILDAEGAQIFADFTSAHVKDSLAIVSDNKIKSYAVINSAITGGQVALTGFGIDEAQNLKKVLQTAWLSVPLSVESQQVIGASLGQEAIQQGVKAIVLGLLLVMVFMFAWYLGSGLNAVVAQVLNLYIMFSVLSALNLTLTLPGIAGMILTIGMAVDANVIVFERIKEELRLGKGRAAAISAGFENAFSAIIDSNVTTFIAAAFMSQLGTGAIQGFAVSLAIGVISSVFTALFVSHLIFDFGTETLGAKKLSIGWFGAQAAAETA
ncbi:protein translocase subunit SecD [Treponema endosymbiont of Eucomonympha sp.]|uniref:protein translocase subunit SecD n=1 Tax=Treponema endosymbiont of Eucomonympha sp. TaxID=1580831 RepID=UPI0007508C67|nr:protein translocase subunit SecD [Treponema endosymbiont of Eucomonympha sp.]